MQGVEIVISMIAVPKRQHADLSQVTETIKLSISDTKNQGG
jgi:hypothetical protein